MPLATERVLQEPVEPEQAEGLGRGRYERQASPRGSRNGYEEGTRKTAAGVLRVQVPQVRGLEEPSRSQGWPKVAKPRDRLTTRIVEMCVGGMSPRAMEAALEKALGQFVLSKSARRTRTDTVSPAYEAFRTRARSGYDGAYLFIDTVEEP